VRLGYFGGRFDVAPHHRLKDRHTGRGRPAFLPTGSRAPSGAVIFSRVSVFVTKKHSTIILRKMLLECFFATKTLMREKITERSRV
jgi:hypothetical protein